MEQDSLSKRAIPEGRPAEEGGQDVFVPWVLSAQAPAKETKKTKRRQDTASASVGDDTTPQIDPSHAHTQDEPPKVYNRYYHMFAKGELAKLVTEAAQGLGLHVGSGPEGDKTRGIEIMQDGWERSNYYVELRRWEAR